jgi:DNA-binding GntR family transcriptional regulator
LKEVLARLASESLVKAIGKSGFKVSPISKKDYQQLISVNTSALELNALRPSIKFGDIN